MEEATRGIQ